MRFGSSPPFPTPALPVHPNADLLSSGSPAPLPALPSEGAHRCQVGRFFPPLSGLPRTVAGTPKLWLAAPAVVQAQRLP